MTLFFYIFATITVAMIITMILQKNPVASALCLVFAFFGLAGLYVLLDAPFVAILQVLVYAGAIMVLFVFVITMMKLSDEDLKKDFLPSGKILGLLLTVASVLFVSFYTFKEKQEAFKAVDPGFGSPTAVSHVLFEKYLLPFEISSLLILVAIIGVVLLGKKRE